MSLNLSIANQTLPVFEVEYWFTGWNDDLLRLKVGPVVAWGGIEAEDALAILDNAAKTIRDQMNDTFSQSNPVIVKRHMILKDNENLELLV